MPSYAPVPGATGAVSINGQILSANHFSWDGEANVMNCSSFTGGDYREYVAGKIDCVMTVSGVWDLGFNPFANNIKVGNTLGSVSLWVNSVVPFVLATSAYCIVESFSVDDVADDLATYNISLRGSWTFNDFSNTAA